MSVTTFDMGEYIDNHALANQAQVKQLLEKEIALCRSLSRDKREQAAKLLEHALQIDRECEMFEQEHRMRFGK